jgi:hypothetical protein
MIDRAPHLTDLYNPDPNWRFKVRFNGFPMFGDKHVNVEHVAAVRERDDSLDLDPATVGLKVTTPDTVDAFVKSGEDDLIEWMKKR